MKPHPVPILSRFQTAFFAVSLLLLSPAACSAFAAPDALREPYRFDSGLISRSISFENPTGAPGEGGKTASRLGPGRKGAPAREIKPGETVQLCDIEGPGMIRHIWITTDQAPAVQRACVIRAWWEGQEHPSIECPIGDLFGFAHGKIMSYESAVHSCGPTGGRNLWVPMPFARRARWTFTNEGTTIVGTGSEDYVGLAWGIQQAPFLYNGCSLNQKNFVSMYRWHLLDPIAWKREARITIQQIAWKDGLHETSDDWSCATFWYEPVPSAQLPSMPTVEARTANIWEAESK